MEGGGGGGGEVYRLLGDEGKRRGKLNGDRKRTREEEVEGGRAVDGNICRLPEGCISHALSFTSPRDSCRAASVCSTFLSAAGSDSVWERFLPSDYKEILSRSVSPINSASKKELYFRHCEPFLIDDGKKSFVLDKSTSKKCYMLSARDLGIAWADTPRYWRWISLPDARFSEVAELLDVCWLLIHGKIDTRELSKKTTYAAYLIHKLAHPHGFSGETQNTTVVVGSHVSSHIVSLEPGRLRQQNSNVHEGLISFPCARNDGWMEMEMGEFFNDEGNDGEVDMSLKEIEVLRWKGGLIIEGIEVRPKKVDWGAP